MAEKLASAANPVCAETRKIIENNGHWINNFTARLHPHESGYDEEQAALSIVYSGIKEAFEAKPEGCEMTEDRDRYSCDRCWVYVVI